MLKIREF